MAIAVTRPDAVEETVPSPAGVETPPDAARATPAVARLMVTTAGVAERSRLRPNPRHRASTSTHETKMRRCRAGRVARAAQDAAPVVDVAEVDEIEVGRVRVLLQTAPNRRIRRSPPRRTARMKPRVRRRSNLPRPCRPGKPGVGRMPAQRPNRRGVATGRRPTRLPRRFPTRCRSRLTNPSLRIRRLDPPRKSLDHAMHRTRGRTRIQPLGVNRHPRRMWMHSRDAPQSRSAVPSRRPATDFAPPTEIRIDFGREQSAGRRENTSSIASTTVWRRERGRRSAHR